MKNTITHVLLNKRRILTQGIIIATAATSLTIAGVSFAQSPIGAPDEQAQLERMEQRLDKRMEILKKELHLSKAQTTQVRQILDSKHTQMRDLRQQYKGDRKALKSASKNVRKTSRAELQKVLNADQFATLKTLKGKHKGKFRRRGRHKGKRMAHLKAELGLSDAQAARIKTIRTKARMQRDTILAKAKSRHAAKPELKVLRLDTHGKIKAVLTPTQAKQFAALKGKHKGKHRGKGHCNGHNGE